MNLSTTVANLYWVQRKGKGRKYTKIKAEKGKEQRNGKPREGGCRERKERGGDFRWRFVKEGHALETREW